MNSSKTFRKMIGLFVGIIASMVLLTNIYPITAAAANKNSMKKTITITGGEYRDYRRFKIHLKKKGGITVKIKIVEMEGKPTDDTIKYWIYQGDDYGKGSLFYNLKAKKLKEGATLVSKELKDAGQNATLEFFAPKGVESMTLKVKIISKQPIDYFEEEEDIY